MSDITTDTTEAVAAEETKAKKGPRQLTEKELEARREVPWMLIPKTIWNALVKYTFEKPLQGVQWVGRKIDDAGRSKKLRSGIQAVLGLPVGIVLRNTGRAMYHMANGDYAKTHMVGAVVGAAAGWWAAGVALAGSLGVTSVAAVTSGGIVSGLASAGIIAASAAATFPLVVPAAMIGAVALTGVVTAVTAGLSLFPALVPNALVGFLRSKDAVQGIKVEDYDGPKEKKALDYDSIREIEERKLYNDVRWQVGSLNDEHQKDIYETLAKKFAVAAQKPAEDDAANNNVAQPAAKAKAKGVTVTP